MIRVLRHYAYIRISILIGFISLCLGLGTCITDEFVFISICRYAAGLTVGMLLELIILNIDKRKKEFAKMNSEPNFEDYKTVGYFVNDPLLFGLANDFIGKDLLYYLPYKINLYTLSTQMCSFLHTMFVSYNKHTNRIRVFDIINKNNGKIDESEPYFVRLTYDIDMSISDNENIIIKPLQVVFYNRDEKKALTLDKDIFNSLYKRPDSISEREIAWACNICEFIMKDNYIINDGFANYFKEFLYNNHLRQVMLSYTGSFPYELDLRNLNEDANVEIIDDDFLLILRDLIK